MADSPLSGFRLLVVEDDADTQEALRSVFELKGAAVTIASSALEGFQSFLRLRLCKEALQQRVSPLFKCRKIVYDAAKHDDKISVTLTLL